MAEQNFRDRLTVPQIKSEQEKLSQDLFSLIDIYQQNNSFENREFLCYLSAAIFLVYKENYPQIARYILFRTKSDMSFIKNIVKEFTKFMANGTENAEFDIGRIEKDVSGIRLVLDNINFCLPATDLSRDLFNDPEIKLLRKKSKMHLELADDIDEYICAPVHSSKVYHEKIIELLKTIIEITPPEFENENDPNPSFETRLKEFQNAYETYSKNDSFPTFIKDADLEYLKDLLNIFRSKIDNNLHFAILHRTLPVVLSDPLIKDILHTTFRIEEGKEEHLGEIKKANGFQSIYYILETPFGEIEMQSQSNRAYYVSTKGSAYHSGYPGKGFDVKEFFELVDPNDEYPLDYYLDMLDSVSADSMDDQQSTYDEMKKHIRIKDSMDLLPAYLPTSLYIDPDTKKSRYTWKLDEEKLKKAIDSGEVVLSTTNSNLHLLVTALSISPYMNVASSGHSSFTTVGIHHKKIIGEFSEAIRKKDANTVLRDMLVERFEDIINNPKKYFPDDMSLVIKTALDVVTKHEEIASKLPKDISLRNVLHYGEKLKSMIIDRPDTSPVPDGTEDSSGSQNSAGETR